MSRLAETICTHALGVYKDMGFKAYETDDDKLVLEHYGEIIKDFNAHMVTPSELQQACHQHFNEDILLGKIQ